MQSLLGVGGMGEVYRARDVKLDRDVAIKILPEAFASDPERVARFEREAKTLAALNHPHVGAIYGLEDAGGATALVLEFVDGPTLADWIAERTPRIIPDFRTHLEDVVAITRQVTEALEAAHGQGIIHRDLKPANIKLAPDGSVKVLDFGLAKAFETAPAVSGMSMSPTMTSPLHTGAGVVLGTAAYISPEQARGRTADKRADIWAFGCLLFEMLAGKRPFEGTAKAAGASPESQADNVADALAAVLRSEPDWSALPAGTPPSLRRLLRRALTKDRKLRLADIADARLDLDEALQASENEAAAASSSMGRQRRWPRIAAEVAGAIVVATIALLAGTRWFDPGVSPSTIRFIITPRADESIDTPVGGNLVISPNGRTIVYTGQNGRLYARRLGELEIKPIPGTEGASQPFFSPDGAQLGFVARGKIQRVPASGGVPVAVCDVQSVNGLSWGDDGNIVFADAIEPRHFALFRVAETGGTPARLTAPTPEFPIQRWPHLLPGSRAVLFNESRVGAPISGNRIVVRDLDTSIQKTVVEPGSDARYVKTGHIVYGTSAVTMMAVPFDLKTLTVTGDPVVAQSGVNVRANGSMNADVSDRGVLVYWEGGDPEPVRQVVWRSRDGLQTTPAIGGDLPFARYVRLSPDGRRLILTLGTSNVGQLWIYDVTGGAQPRRVTFDAHSIFPAWSGDGKQLFFRSDREGAYSLYRLQADGSAVAPVKIAEDIGAFDIAPDGHLVFTRTLPDPKRGDEFWHLDLNGDGKATKWFESTFNHGEPRFSHDGRWLAYVSDENRRAEVYVRPYPGPGVPVRVSSDGGHEPVWSRDDKELFFQEAEGPKLLSAAIISTTPEFRVGRPRILFQGGFVGWAPLGGRSFDVGLDGRFLLTQQKNAEIPQHFVVTTNWFEELKRLAPVK